MMKKTLILGTAAVLFAALLSLPSKASACSSMGPGKHMGLVVMIDAEKGVMSIIDAESRQPIEFVLSASLLKKIKKQDEVVVSFQEQKDQLVVKDIKVHRS